MCELLTPGDARERLLLHKGKNAVVVMNRFPYTNGHLMIAPTRHIGSLAKLTQEENQEIMKLAAESVEIAQKTLNAEGFNIGINLGKVAGAGIIDHLHLHVVPRWVGDSNFMPVISDTKAMPEYLLSTYDRLIHEFRSLK